MGYLNRDVAEAMSYFFAHMARGKLNSKFLDKAKSDFGIVDDTKLRMTISALTDKYDENIRQFILHCYQDTKLLNLYHSIRTSGTFQHGGKSKVHRKIVEFPNGYVYDFVDTVLTAIYDQDWMSNPKALKHELVRPWHVVKNL